MEPSNPSESDIPYSDTSVSQKVNTSRHKILPPRTMSFLDKDETSGHHLWSSMLGTLNYENLHKLSQSPGRNSKIDKGSQTWNSQVSDCTINGFDVTSVNGDELPNYEQNGIWKMKNGNFGNTHVNNPLNPSRVTESCLYSDGSATVKGEFGRSFDTDNSASPMGSNDSTNFPVDGVYGTDILDNKQIYGKGISKRNTYLNNHFSIGTNHSMTLGNPLLKHSSSIRSNKSSDNSINSTGCPNDSDVTDANDIRYSSGSRIIESKGKHIVVTVHNAWNSEDVDSVNTLSVQKLDKVELIARCDDWIYVKMMNPNATNIYGWIPEYTLIESELLSRKFYNIGAQERLKSL